MQASCPVCSCPTTLFDVVDFNKSCEEVKGKFLPSSGVPVEYVRCGGCGFVFAPLLAAWSDDEFLARIYNESYGEIDPDYLEARPQANADLLERIFGASSAQIRHLDYGGGNGRLSELLTARRWQSRSYDPFPAGSVTPETLGRFNLISVFEVFEHVPDVKALMRNLLVLMEEASLVLFSTWVSDGHIAPGGRLNWWYAAPRNGHISLFTRQSLKLLAEQNGLTFGSFNHVSHCFFRTLPGWAEPVVLPRLAVSVA